MNKSIILQLLKLLKITALVQYVSGSPLQKIEKVF